MGKIFTLKSFKVLLFLVGFFCAQFAFAQSPQLLNYQGAVRNSNGAAVPNQDVSLRLSVLDGTAQGLSVYSETRNVKTNSLGLYTVQIASPGASAVSGNFAAIKWGEGAKFLKVEIDVNGGTNFTLAGVSQLLSVPYA